MKSRSAIGAASAVLLLWQASAQEPVPAAKEPRSDAEASRAIDEVVVRSRRMGAIETDLHIHAEEYVGLVAVSPPGRGYARWHGDVCVDVRNLKRPAAQFLVDRVSSLAAEVGLEPGEPDCAPEVIVMFTTNGNELAASLVENEPLLFRPTMGRAGTSLGLAALDEFVESDRPVRWWHVSMPVDARTGQPAIRLAQQDRTSVISVAGPSRLHSGIRDDMRRVIIIVDSTKLSGTTWQQLADYLAFISLAQIDPEAGPAAFASVLNLFSNPAAYTGLTDWDRSYIRALYAFNQERTARIQASEVASKMVQQQLGRDE